MLYDHYTKVLRLPDANSPTWYHETRRTCFTVMTKRVVQARIRHNNQDLHFGSPTGSQPIRLRPDARKWLISLNLKKRPFPVNLSNVRLYLYTITKLAHHAARAYL